MEIEKTKALDQKLNTLLDRFPQFSELSIIKEKDRFIAFLDHEFIRKRSTEHLLRVFFSQFLNKKKLLSVVLLASKNRCVEFRIIPTKMEFPFVSKWVIGIPVQFSLNNRYELFDHEQLLKAVQKFIPDLKIVKGSIYMFQGPGDSIKTLYAEFEKTSNQPFTLAELKALKTSLGDELLLRIERLVPAVFMTRNQEEVLRNILTLSQQIEHVTDWPQVMISFETQTAEEFVFNVVCVRPENNGSISIENLLKQRSSVFQWLLERKQLVKYLDQHQPIFAYIFRILLTPNPAILRNDGSLNFFAARQKIGSFLKENIGEFRDFNGGILIKQEETLDSLKNALPDLAPELIENVFYSIAPIEMQAILSLHVLKTLLQLFMQISESPLLGSAEYIFKNYRKDHLLLVMIRIPNGAFYELAKETLVSFDLPDIKQASIALPLQDSYLFGYLLETDSVHLQTRFLESAEKLLVFWSDEVKKQQVLRLGLDRPITSLDPRIGGDAVSALFLKMLFEGLMRTGPTGILEKGIADHIEISPDNKTYLFRLRPSIWSDGSPLTSYDFEYAWKKILSPRFNTNFAYLFFRIKNAELAKKGMAPMSQVGVHALDDLTLKIELESPAPNFLEYLVHPLFSPVCRQLDINEPNWSLEEGSGYVCNGAFKIEKNLKDSSYAFIRNPFYWQKEKIYLDRILIAMSHHSQSYSMFSQNKIHWLGAPMGVWGNSFKLGANDEAVIYPDHGVYWCVCNTKHPLLKNAKIRQAMALAIDRLQLLDAINYPKNPAYSPLPSLHSQISHHPIFDNENADKLFREGLEESGLTGADLPPLNIAYTLLTEFGKASAEVVSSQWKQKLDINTTIQGHEYKNLLSKIVVGDFHIAFIRWQAWINDPFYTLNVFANPDEAMNFSKWSHPDFKELLIRAQIETDENQRKLLLYQIEEMLIREMPIIPLFDACMQFMKKKSLQLTPNHSLVDFKWARFVQPQTLIANK